MESIYDFDVIEGSLDEESDEEGELRKMKLCSEWWVKIYYVVKS